MAPMSLYALSRSAGAKLLADTPATMVAMPPPSQRVKPRTCTSIQKPRIAGLQVWDTEPAAFAFSVCLLTVHYFGYRLASRVSRFQIVPELNPLFPLFPTPKDLLTVELTVEVHQSRLESLEHAADLLELEQELVDLARDVVDAAAQRELVGRFAPFGSSLRRHELVLRHEITPGRVERDQIGDDALDQGESTVGFCKSKVFARHGTNLDAQTRRRT